MTGAAWFALTGLVAFVAAGLMLTRSLAIMRDTLAERAVMRRIAEQCLTAQALWKGGDHDEAQRLLERALDQARR